MKALLLSLLIIFPLYGFDHSHSQFDAVLKKHVVFKGAQSFVDYNEIRKRPDQLNKYLEALSNVSKTEFTNWNQQEQLVFLINAYNAFTIKLLIDNEPVKSIKKLGSIFKSAWKKKFINLLGETIHLDHIEHVLIRENYDEPKIHFALVCASISCPPLLDEAFNPEKLEQQFERAINIFLKDKDKNYYDSEKNIVYVSKIFRWYGDDFKNKHGTFLNFIAPYLGDKKSVLQADIKYLSYDWNLNTQ